MTVFQSLKQLFFPGITIPVSVNLDLEETITIEQNIPDGSVELVIAVEAAVANMKAFGILGGANMTVFKNANTDPTPFNLVANEGQGFIEGEGTNPVTADLTQLLVTNSSGADGLLQVVIGIDTTP